MPYYKEKECVGSTIDTTIECGVLKLEFMCEFKINVGARGNRYDNIYTEGEVKEENLEAFNNIVLPYLDCKEISEFGDFKKLKSVR